MIDLRRLLLRCCFGSSRVLFKADDAQNWAIRAELHVRTYVNLNRPTDLLAVYISSETRIRVCHDTAAIGEPELCMAARNHRPLVLREKEMTDRRVATDEHNIAGERALAQQLAAAILCENDLHSLLRPQKALFDIWHLRFVIY